MKYKSLENTIRFGVKTESKYKSFGSALRSIFEKKTVETDIHDQIVVGTYRTQNFEMCPTAQKVYSNLPSDININAAEKAAIFLDQLFALEKSVVASKKATSEDIEQATLLAKKAMHMAKDMDMVKEHSFVQDHIKNIESFHKVEDGNPKTDITPEHLKNLFSRPSLAQTPEKKDMDIDNKKFKISHNLKAQRKLKIIDND